jgi:lipopolysaccharide transport system ATP-binding protein
MSDFAIKVENVSKLYRIGAKESTLLSERITNGVKSFFGKNPKNATQEFWALNDVSLEIKHGEAVGIIGKNGAGKSTLLKVLSRITEPTNGQIKINGRIASLLEVGTGFHPELTGRENIFMNGSILGMKQAEIKRKLDEIIDFAGVEKFIDTPVKHYSSGMYVRLAFAVAAHLEPEILIIDEVLAVGDAEFQRKCLGKMNEVTSKEGRTVIFVSHSMPMITSLCNKAFLMKSGQVALSGNPADVVLGYYNDGQSAPSRVNFQVSGKKIGNEFAELIEGYVKSKSGEYVSDLNQNEPVIIGMRYKITSERAFKKVFPYPNANIFAPDGTHVFYTSKPNSELSIPEIGEYTAEFEIPASLLNVGTYYVGLAFSSCDTDGVNIHFYEQSALVFHISENLEDDLYDKRNGYSGPMPGVINPKLKWSLYKSQAELNTV